MKKRLFAFIVTPMLILSACARDNQPKEIDYHSLVFNYPALELEIGKSQTLKVKSGMPDENSVITWVTSDKNVATVTKAGLVYAYKEGTCTVTGFIDANSNGQLDEKEYYGECQVTDFLKDKGLNFSVSDKELDLQMEQTRYVSAYIKPAPESGNYYYLTYTVEDPSIAKVTKDSSYNTRALVKAIGLGSTDVTVTYGGQTAIFTINVTPWIEGDKTHVASIAFSEDTKVIQKTSEANPTYQTAVEILPSTATNKKISYSSNNPDVATVDENGVVTGLTGGSAIITAVSEDLQKTASMNIVVQDTFTTYETDLYAGYYNGLTTWENGEDLIDKLHDIIKDYTPKAYVKSGEWTDLRTIDEAIDNPSSLDTIYSLYDIDKAEQSTSYNREHAFCASLMTGFTTGDATSQKGRATDYHNLFAAGRGGNSARSNKNLGYADVNEPTYLESDEGYSSDRLNFEPGNEDKGRLARALFYMTTMYNEEVDADVTDSVTFTDEDAERYGQGSKTVHIIYKQKPLVIREEYADYSKVSFTDFHYQKNDKAAELYEKYVTLPEGDYDIDELLAAEAEGYAQYSTDNCDFAIGNLSDVLAFSSYSIDYSEYKRNDAVQAVQGNRNPFIDYPELIYYAYGALKDQPGSLENIRSSKDILNTDSGETICYAVTSYKDTCPVGATFDSSCYTLKAVKTDLSKVDVDPEVDLSEPYVITHNDFENGYIIYPVVTNMNTINLKIKVTPVDTESANYKFSNFRADMFANKKINSTEQEVVINGITWLVSSKNEVGVTNVNTPVTAIKIGTSSNYPSTVTFKTKEAFSYQGMNKIAAVFVQANAGSNRNYNVSIKVGSSFSVSNLLEYNASSYPVVGATLATPAQGIVTITFTNVDYFMNLQTIGIKTVE